LRASERLLIACRLQASLANWQPFGTFPESKAVSEPQTRAEEMPLSRLAPKAGHMTATCNDQNQLKSILAKPGSSKHDTNRLRLAQQIPTKPPTGGNWLDLMLHY
jgi:hypothetical protein